MGVIVFVRPQAINMSLTCLGNVVAGLYSEKQHIPYRDSKLTRVLKSVFADSHSRILVITCLSPTVVCPNRDCVLGPS